MKRKIFLIVAAVLLLSAVTAATTAAASFLKLTAVDYAFTFNFGSCTVTTQESQTEHRFLGRHVLSTIVGSVTLAGTCTVPGTAVTLPTGVGLPFAAVDVFNPLVGGAYSTKSYGMAVVPSLPGMPAPVRAGVHAWRVKLSPPVWCGYGYLYTGPDKSDYMLAPFKAELQPNGQFALNPSPCGTVPIP